MFATYENPNYELKGNWDSDTGQMLLWFPVTDISLRQRESFDGEPRTQKLLRDMGMLTVEPDISLATTDDMETAIASLLMPEIEKSPERFQCDGLIIVDAKFMSQMGKSAMERCGTIIEDVYSDQMFERVQS
jgi:hypothetical protein